MDMKKVSCMLDWPVPRSVKELRGFLSLIGYYRKFIQSYGLMAKPLTKLLKKKGFSWSNKAQKAFEALKQVMVSAPILALPNFNELFVVEFDTSNKDIGAVLSQCGHPLTYFNKGLGPKHQALSI